MAGHFTTRQFKKGNFTFSTYSVSTKGHNFLHNTQPSTQSAEKLHITVTLRNLIRREYGTGDSSKSITWGAGTDASIDVEVRQKLLNIRAALAREHNVPPYVVIGYQSLVELAQRKPVSLEELKLVPGFSEQKVLKYGRAFLIFATSNNTQSEVVKKRPRLMDVQPSIASLNSSNVTEQKANQSHAKRSAVDATGLQRTLSSSLMQTYKAWLKHRDVKAVAVARGLRPKVIKQQLRQCDKQGCEFDSASRLKLKLTRNESTLKPIAASKAQHSDDEFSDVDIAFDYDF